MYNIYRGGKIIRKLFEWIFFRGVFKWMVENFGENISIENHFILKCVERLNCCLQSSFHHEFRCFKSQSIGYDLYYEKYQQLAINWTETASMWNWFPFDRYRIIFQSISWNSIFDFRYPNGNNVIYLFWRISRKIKKKNVEISSFLFGIITFLFVN